MKVVLINFSPIKVEKLRETKEYIKKLEDRMQNKLEPNENTEVHIDGQADDSKTSADEWWQLQSAGKSDYDVSMI